MFDFARHLNGEFACMADLNGCGAEMLCGHPHWGAGEKCIICEKCGFEFFEKMKYCPKCGAVINPSPKSRTIAAILAFFLGFLGIHRFYLGKIISGILQILATFCFGIGYIWSFIDLIIIISGNFKDKKGLLVSSWKIKY